MTVDHVYKDAARRAMGWAQSLAPHAGVPRELTCTYLTRAHLAMAAKILEKTRTWRRSCS